MSTTQPNAEWEEQYNPLTLDDDDSSLLHPWSTVVDLPENTVWSVVEDRQGRLVAVAGRRSNTSCLDYAVTEKPWVTGEERGYWLPLDAETDLGYVRDTTGWTTEVCENNGDCDGTPPEEHLFPPYGQRVRVLHTEDEVREVGRMETYTIDAGNTGEVVIVDPDIHQVAVLLDGRRLWIDPTNLTNSP